MFIGRERELETLNGCYGSGKFEFVAIYGRRRIGKTALIREFCRNKKTIFFPALETDAKNNLNSLSAAIFRCNDPKMTVFPSFNDFDQAFRYISKMAEDERIVFVIDEYPYLVNSDPSVPSLLQHMTDHLFKETKLMIILCGSSMSFMEKQVLGYQSPLYGRRTAQIKLLPFRYLEIKKWFPSYTPEELALVYGTIGGVPMYLERFSEKRSVHENILNEIMSTKGLLYEEPSNLMKQELREPQTYNAIITAIAAGRTKLSEISSAVGLGSGPLTGYIDNLISLGIVKKERPMLSEGNKRTVYLIADNFFRFWYRFVPRNTASIISGTMPEIFCDSVVAEMPDYMGLVFEEICKEYLVFKDGDIPFVVTSIGQWWGTDAATRTQMQIDVVALSYNSREMMVGSCKYRNRQTSLEVLNELVVSSKAMGGSFDRIYYYVFSKSGFDPQLTEIAGADSSVRLITLDDIYGT
jgi:AAA+ ATPase superfamily predicted ATPase